MNISGIFPPTAASTGTTQRTSPATPAPNAPKYSPVEEQFLAYAKMSPMERMRASILKDMNLTEDDVKSMSAADQKKLEEKIKELIKQEIEKDLAKKGQLIDIAV